MRKTVFQPGSSEKQNTEQTVRNAAGFPDYSGRRGMLAVIWLSITLKGGDGF